LQCNTFRASRTRPKPSKMGNSGRVRDRKVPRSVAAVDTVAAQGLPRNSRGAAFPGAKLLPFLLPFTIPQSRERGAAAGRRRGGRRMAPTAYQSGVRASDAAVRRARPLRTIRILHRTGDVITRCPTRTLVARCGVATTPNTPWRSGFWPLSRTRTGLP
jgi:hypothetical protein